MKQPFLSTGTLQKNRAQPALLPEYVQVDEKKIDDYLVFIKKFSALVQYWNEQNNPQGNWQIFFNEDLSFLLAYIGQVDISTFPHKHDSYVKKFNASHLMIDKEEAIMPLLLLIFDIIKLIKDWYLQIIKQSQKDQDDNQIEVLITELIKSNIWKGSLAVNRCYKDMIYSFQQFPDVTANQNVAEPAHFAALFFKDLLSPDQDNELDAIPPAIIKSIDFNTYQGFFNYLDQLYHNLYGTLALIQQSIPSFLIQSLEQSNHSPDISLILAFWDMLDESKQLINQFTAKHLDFYYLDVLQQRQAAATPDQVLIHFTLRPTVKETFLPQGTPFLAGNSPTGQPLLYTLDQEVSINQAKPVFFKTIYNGTTNLSTLTAAPGLIYAAPIANSENGIGGKFVKKPASWPSLGLNLKNPNAPTLAQLGFAISDPLLYLSEGNRQVTIVLKLTDNSINLLKQEVIKIGINEIDYWEGLELLINQSFTLEYTSTKKWISPTSVETWLMPLPVSEHQPNTQQEKPGMGIVFFLNINTSQPPVTSYNSKVHGRGYTTNDPLVRFKMRQQITIKKNELSKKIITKNKETSNTLTLNPYPLLSKIEIESIPIYIEAEGLQDFSVQNDFSVLNAKKPYAPFGTTPVVNNHFYLGNNEVFRKPLNFLGLKIDWFDIPKLPSGFCEYYYSYNLLKSSEPFYNSIFKWKLDMLAAEGQTVDEKWKPIDFTNQLFPVQAYRSHPLNPSDPEADKKLYNDLGDPDSPPPPPGSLSPELAGKIVDQASKKYGSNWAKNNPDSVSQSTANALTPATANKIIDKLSPKYGKNWEKNSPSSTSSLTSTPNTPDKGLSKEHAKNILDQLSKKYGKNWNRNTPNINKGLNLPLFIFKGSNFQGKPVIADILFKDALERINQYAKKNNVKIHVTSSFRTSSDVKGAIVTPAKKSNHMVGHAIDMNLVFNNTEWANSQYLHKSNEDIWDPAVKGFITDIENDKDLRWGGDFHKEDPVHIDDGLNLKNPPKWEERYKATQAAWKAKPFDGKTDVTSQPNSSAPSQEKTIPPPSKKEVAQKLAKAIIELDQANTPVTSNTQKPDSKALADTSKNPTESNPATTKTATEIPEGTTPKTSGDSNDKPPVDTVPDSTKATPLEPAKKEEGNNIFEWEPAPKEEKKEEPANGSPTKKDQAPNADKSEGNKNSDTEDLQKKHAEPLTSFFKTVEDNVIHPKKKKELIDTFTKIAEGKKKALSLSTGLSILKGVKNIFKKKPKETPPELGTGPASTSTPGSENPPSSDGETPPSEAPKTTDNKDKTQALVPLNPAAAKCPHKNEGKLKSQSLVLIKDFKNIDFKSMTPPSSFSSKTTYGDQVKDGFLRFTLTTPEYAFGEAKYPRIVAAVANYNMDLMLKKISSLIPLTAAQKKEKEEEKAKELLKGGPNGKLIAFMIPINKFLNDPILKLINPLKIPPIIKPYKDAKKEAGFIEAAIKGGTVAKNLKGIEAELKTILNFLYLVGAIIQKAGGHFPEHGDKIKKVSGVLKKVFGHIPFIKTAENVLLASNPIVSTAVKTIGAIAKKNHPKDHPPITEDYTEALEATNGAIQLIKGVISGVDTLNKVVGPTKPLLPPRPAYIPRIAKITANYSAQSQINFKSPTSKENQFFHIHPFGISAPEPAKEQMGLLPVYSEEGYLYIALDKVNSPEIVSLLFILNTESGDRDLQLPELKWQYLKKGKWINFLSASVKDGTNNLSQPGVISFNLPELKIETTNLFIDKNITRGYYWIRAITTKNTAALCEIIQVVSQAALATYAGDNLDPKHYNAPLSAKKISKFYKPQPDIAKVEQPLSSFGGRAPEDKPTFYTRVNERLRHKDRAVNSWDFERLVLQQFPEIGLVRCLSHTSLTQSLAPGNTTVLILPKKESPIKMSLAPKTDQGKISLVKQYLNSHIDPFLKLHVRNPQYQFIKIKLEAILSPGLDPGHYLKILNEDLIQTIAPWSLDPQNLNPFKNKISFFGLLEFINQQTYIEEVIKFQIFLLKSPTDIFGKRVKKSLHNIIPINPWTILSSVENHTLKVVTEEQLINNKKHKKKKTPDQTPNQNIKQDQKVAKTVPTGETTKTEDKKTTPDPKDLKKGQIPKPVKLNALYIRNNLYK